MKSTFICSKYRFEKALALWSETMVSEDTQVATLRRAGPSEAEVTLKNGDILEYRLQLANAG